MCVNWNESSRPPTIIWPSFERSLSKSWWMQTESAQASIRSEWDLISGVQLPLTGCGWVEEKKMLMFIDSPWLLSYKCFVFPLSTVTKVKWATSKFTQVLTKFWVKLLLLLENALKLNFWGPPLTNWKFEPSPMSQHTLTPTSINTQNRSKKYVYGFIMACIAPHERGHWKARIWLPLAFQKKFHWSWTQLQRGQPTPYVQGMLFPTHLRLECFGHTSTPSHRPWTEAYYTKF